MCNIIHYYCAADDVDLFSYPVSGLQKQLDILEAFCAACELTVIVNLQKGIDDGV